MTPKSFLQALTLDHARQLLRDSASVLDASYEVGLSGPGRLHDLFVTHEAMSPGEWKTGGDGRDAFATASTLAVRKRAGDGDAARACGPRLRGCGRTRGGPRRHVRALAEGAEYVEDPAATAPLARRIFDPTLWRADQPLRVVLIGTDFEVRVWETLLRIPLGRASTYSDIARSLGRPQAARAVGGAVGRNPLSFVVPCHRVLGKSGALTGYHWGVSRKHAIIGWEAAKAPAAP